MKRSIFLLFTLLTLACLLLSACGSASSDKKEPETPSDGVVTPSVSQIPETDKKPKRHTKLDADYLYGSGMQNRSDSPNDPDGAYYGVGVTQVMFGIRHGGPFTEMVGNLMFNSRDKYTWTLHVSSYADKSDTADYVIEPADCFSTSTATIYQFEACLAKNAFVPEKDRVYYIDLTIEGTNVVYDITGSADGYVLNAQPVGGSFLQNGVANLSIGPHAQGDIMGWENSKASGEDSAQTHLLLRVYGDTSAAYKNATWQITLDGGGTAKTVTLTPSSHQQTEQYTLYRFKTCLEEGDNRFIPRKDVDYRISAEICQNGKTVAVSRERVSGFIPLEKAIVPPAPVIKPGLDASQTILPIISITTEDGEAVPTDKSEVSCTVSLDSKEAQYCAENLAATIRCRGNGSMTVGKNTGKFPYKLKFDNKITPFGLGEEKEKDWVLLAHVGDQSMLRNYAAKLMGDLLSGIPYSPNVMFVNVYLNGEYIGVYELCEQVEVKDSRIDVNDKGTEPEIGFLLELDAYASGVYIRAGGMRFAVKSDTVSDEQIEFIQDYIERVNTAIENGDRATLETLVDMDSLVDMYLIHEFAKNIDVGWSSFFMYREVGGKLIFAPPWDFDLTFGNDARLDGGSYEGLYVGPGKPGFMQNHEWYNQLYTNLWFRDLVAERWREISDTVVTQVIEAVKQMAEYMEEDMNRNYERWDFLGHKQQQEPKEIYTLTTYKEHGEYLVNWMQNRKAWMDAEFSM